VGSICKQINKIYANEDEDMKVTFWSNVAVNRNLAKLCFKDHEKLGRRIYEMQSMVANIGEVAAKLGNVKVFKWALWHHGMSTLMTIIGLRRYSKTLQRMDT
jgi:hypothetical protein